MLDIASDTKLGTQSPGHYYGWDVNILQSGKCPRRTPCSGCSHGFALNVSMWGSSFTVLSTVSFTFLFKKSLGEWRASQSTKNGVPPWTNPSFPSQPPWDLLTLPLSAVHSCLVLKQLLVSLQGWNKSTPEAVGSLFLLHDWMTSTQHNLPLKPPHYPAPFLAVLVVSEHAAILQLTPTSPHKCKFTLPLPSPQHLLKPTRTFLCDKLSTENHLPLKMMANWKNERILWA